MDDEMILSTLPKTWVFDLDGTLLKHNGYKLYGEDSILPGVLEYFESIPSEDVVIILTSRTDEYREMTINFLKKNNIRFDKIIFNIPMGERILVNDRKPSGLDMAIAVNVNRDDFSLKKIKREK